MYEHTTDTKSSVPRRQTVHGSVPELRSSEADVDTAETYKSEQENFVSYLTQASITSGSKSAPTSVRNSLILEDDDESNEEDESVSITTGRLSLSLGADSINVKSEIIQTEQIDAVEHTQQVKQEEEEQDHDQLRETETAKTLLPVEKEVALEEGQGQNPGNCGVGGISVVSGGMMCSSFPSNTN